MSSTPPQFGKAVARRHRHRKHEPLRIAHASGAQSRAGRRARRNAVINYNRRAASDLRTFAIAQVTLAPPLDFGEFGVANGFESVFVNSDVDRQCDGFVDRSELARRLQLSPADGAPPKVAPTARA